MDRDCWAKELLEGLVFVDPSKDWQTHMMQLKPIENPRGVAGLAKQKFADIYIIYREFDSDPTDPECPYRQRSTYCHLMHHADGRSLLVAPACISADMPRPCPKESHCRCAFGCCGPNRVQYQAWCPIHTAHVQMVRIRC
jgi:hypothetical protein